ncbi:hypothetical protein GW796_07755 [archaeon]|nr:hypothetical protein [archaeon]
MAMLQKFKEFMNSTNNQIQSIQNQDVTEVLKSAESKIIDRFEDFVSESNSDSNVPRKVIQYFKEILVLAKDIHFDDMTLDNQSLVRKIIDVDTRTMLHVYLSIPKAHAVSVILDNGKTAKDTLIENTHNLYNKINQICEETLVLKTELLLNKQKISKKVERKKDFFDL